MLSYLYSMYDRFLDLDWSSAKFKAGHSSKINAVMPKLSKLKGVRYFGNGYDFLFPLFQELEEGKRLEYLEVYSPSPLMNHGFIPASSPPNYVSIDTLAIVDRSTWEKGHYRINAGHWQAKYIDPMLKSIKNIRRLTLRGRFGPNEPEFGRFPGIWERLGEHLSETLEELIMEHEVMPYYYFQEAEEEQEDEEYGYDRGLSIVCTIYIVLSW